MQDFNLIGLGGLAALAALTQNPLPLIVGAAAEALYLINAPGSTWFERYLALQRARRRSGRREAWRRQTLVGLPRVERERFRAVGRRLQAATQALDPHTRRLAQAELDRVDELLDQMLELQAVRLAARAYLANVDAKALRTELGQVHRRVRDGGDQTLARVEAQRLDVLERRLHEYAEMERNVEIVSSQIATLEHSIGYLADKLISWSAAGREPQGLNEILAGVESTERAMEEVRPVLDQIHRVREA